LSRPCRPAIPSASAQTVRQSHSTVVDGAQRSHNLLPHSRTRQHK
jgi:hypothetical protein